ncbi:MAG: type II secretion system GspH family protein [Alphaproteobacteria bacterium]|nr:type II secretion system GspH family protein [Alphaproteobacteria bacterium]MDY4689469.1 type II secretion system protein [Alphaproteobacteria bacterium]
MHKYWLREDSWDKPKNDECWERRLGTFSQSGRSMIEMLGVLAIIGVLSVGGIAGYSKAMEKFKINKAIEEYSYLINGMLDYVEFAQKYKSDQTYVGATQIAEAAGLIPQTWIRRSDYAVDDAYGNYLQVYINSSSHNLVIDFYLQGMSKAETNQYTQTFSGKLCMEIFNNIIIPLNSVILTASLFRSKNGGKLYYGQSACISERRCIRNMTLSDVRDTCNYCTGEDSCAITLFF